MNDSFPFLSAEQQTGIDAHHQDMRALQINSLSEYTVQQLVFQNKFPHIGTGQGQRGKILVPKPTLLKYLRKSA